VSKKSVAVSVSRLITEQVTNSALCRLDARYDRRSGRMTECRPPDCCSVHLEQAEVGDARPEALNTSVWDRNMLHNR